jgi:hypothetical protein
MADISADPYGWSTSEGSNSPAGSTTIGAGLDDNLRAIQAGVKTLRTRLSSVSGTNTVTASIANVAAYAAGQQFSFTPASDNSGATTLNINSLGAKNIFANGVALAGGELRSGIPVAVEYDGTQFNILGLAPTVPLYGGIGKNAIIGGDFSTNPWQRGTSFSSVASGTYTADRFIYSKSGAMVHDITKAADAPTVAQAGRLTNHCIMVDCTTLDGTIGAAEYCLLSTKIEGYNFLPLAQRSFTLSFWHKHTKTGIYCVSFRNSGDDRSWVAEYTQDTTDTWEKATVTVTASPSAGTWDYTNGIGMNVTFALACGSDFQGAAGAWNSAQDFASSNQVNACDSASNNFKIALLQLEAGSVATEFEARSVQHELVLCQRYYEKSYAVGVAPATASTVGLCNVGGSQAGKGTGYIEGGVRFAVTKRATPTMAIYDNAGTVSKCSRVNSGVASTDAQTAATATPGDSGFTATSSTGADANAFTFHFTAAAEL